MPVFADLLRIVQQVLFGIMGIVALRYWHERRGKAEAWLAAAFGSIGLVLVGSIAQPQFVKHSLGLGHPLLWLVKTELSVVLVFPYLLLLFANELRPTRRFLKVAGGVLSLLVVCTTLALPRIPASNEPRPWWIVALLVLVLLQWGVVGPTTAMQLWRAGQGQPRVARRRMELLSLGAGSLLLSLAPSIMSSSNNPSSAAHLAGQAAGIIATGLFFLGLVPPSFMRARWRRPVFDALLDGELDLMRANTYREVADAVLPLAAAMLGGRRAALIDADGAAHGMIGFTDEDLADLRVLAYRVHQSDGPVAVTSRTIVLGLDTCWLIAETGAYSPFFGRDEASALSRLGVFANLALNRVDALENDSRAREALIHQALHDALTGLPNRVLLLDRLQQALARRSRSTTGVAVLFLDIDRFKWINDSLGHQAGDLLLIEQAARLKSLTRDADTVARFGGDEFVLVCEQIEGEEAIVALAERCLQELSAPITVEGAHVTPTVSIGIAHCFGEGDCAAEDLLRDADAAMYQAKENGRACYEIFGEPTRVRIGQRLEMEQGLRQAIDCGDIVVYYQPEIDLATSEVVSVEALARWFDPVRGVRVPTEFIPAAEETGLIIPLGRQVLQTACLDAINFVTNGHTTSVAVNLSARQLLAPQLVETIKHVLWFSEMPPERLVIEITESVLLTDLAAASSAIGALKDLGLRIAIDDFGTGYSSLLYLKGLPIDYVKIDRAFTSGLGHNDQDQAIVSAIIDMAHAFGLTATAEGVEQTEQLTVLRELGCERAQGYFWSPPLPATDMSRWIATHAGGGPGPLEDRVGQRVLVIDDDPALRQVVRIMLSDDSTIDIQEAQDGRTGVNIAGRYQPDVILLDLALPGMGGLDALPLLRAVAPGARILVLSAVDSPELAQRALAQGAAAYLQKHLDLGRLPRLVQPVRRTALELELPGTAA